MIELENISKRFRGVRALHPLELRIPRGAVCGLLGHNGAGKSTLLGILLGQVYPDSGRARIGGADVFRHRRRALARVGAIYETPGFFPYLSGLTNLRIYCEYTAPAPRERLLEAARLAGIADAIRAPVRTYSCGMRQRLALAQALVPDPEILVLDEPGMGLDPEGYHDMRETLRRLHRERGMTLLLSSHLLAEVEQICTHIAVLRNGRLRFAGAWRPEAADWLEFGTDRPAEAARELQRAGIVNELAREGVGRLEPGRSPADAAERLVALGFRIRSLRVVPPSLEDFYLRLTGDSGGEEP